MSQPPPKKQKQDDDEDFKDKPRLCLNFDVNETIMIGDPAGGDTFEDSLNKILCKIAFVKPVPEGEQDADAKWKEWCWHDGSPLDPSRREEGAPPPPLLPDAFADPPGCVRLYNVKDLKNAFAKKFTEPDSPGVIYRETFDKCLNALKWPADLPLDKRLASEEGYYHCLPAFFKTLATLHASGRPFSVIVRTFGHDLPRVQSAINAFCDGYHPLFKGCKYPELKLPDERLWLGRYKEADGSFTLVPQTEGAEALEGDLWRQKQAAAAENGSSSGGAPAADESSVTQSFESEGAMLEELQGPPDELPRLSAVQDDYDWWKGHGYSPSAGKPLWLTLDKANRWGRHLFFDDNIHADPDDSIVAVRARKVAGVDSPFTAVSGAATIKLHGSVTKKVAAMCPILDHTWFLQQVNVMEKRFDALEGVESSSSINGAGDEVQSLESLAKIVGLEEKKKRGGRK